MNPTKEPTETQRALASRMQHLLTAGHPSYVESGALRLIVEHDAALEQQASSYAEQTALAITQRDAATARAEAAESLASKGKSAVNAAILYMAMDSDSEDFDEAQFHRLRDEAQEFLALTPASMVSKLAELEKERDQFKAIAAEGRKAGREEALQIILHQDAEDPFEDARESHPIGDTGDYSSQWNEAKLREILDVEPGAMSSLLERLDIALMEKVYTASDESWRENQAMLEDLRTVARLLGFQVVFRGEQLEKHLSARIAEQDAELARLREELGDTHHIAGERASLIERLTTDRDQWKACAQNVDAKMLAEQADHNKTVDRLVACKAQRDALIAAGDDLRDLAIAWAAHYGLAYYKDGGGRNHPMHDGMLAAWDAAKGVTK